MEKISTKVWVFVGVLALFATGCTQNQFEEELSTAVAPDEPIVTNPVIIEETPEDPFEVKNFSSFYDQKASERKVDLLVVVDNSTSMIPDQEKLSREFSKFISHIKDSDYRIGVITTDTDSQGKENTPGFWGNLDVVPSTGLRYISKSDVNPSELFSELINRKETLACDKAGRPVNCVSFEERPLVAVRMAIEKRATVNSGFFRKDADLGVVIITDEDETSFKDGAYFSAEDLLSHFKHEFGLEKKMMSFSIAIPDGDKECFDKQAAETNTGAASYGNRIGALAQLTGGFTANICNENFSSDLANISSYVRKNLLPLRVRVAETFLPETLKLVVLDQNGKKQKGYRFSVEEGYLRVNPSLKEGDRLAVKYKYRKRKKQQKKKTSKKYF